MDYSHFNSVITQPFDKLKGPNKLRLDSLFNLDIRHLLKGLDGMVFLVDYIDTVNERFYNGSISNMLFELRFCGGVDPKKELYLVLNKCPSYEVFKPSNTDVLVIMKGLSMGNISILISLDMTKSLGELLIPYNWTGIKVAFDANNMYYTPYVEYCFDLSAVPLFIKLSNGNLVQGDPTLTLLHLNSLNVAQRLLGCTHPINELDTKMTHEVSLIKAKESEPSLAIDRLRFKYVKGSLTGQYLCQKCEIYYTVSLFSSGVYKQHKRRLTHLYITLRSFGLLPELVINIYYLMTCLETHELITACMVADEILKRPSDSDESYPTE